MTRKLQYALIVGQLIVFIGTIGIGAYFAQVQRWLPFWITVCTCALLFFGLLVAQSAEVLALVRARERKQYRFQSRFDEYGIGDIYNIQTPVEQQDRNEATQEIIDAGSRFSLLSISAASYIDPGIKRHWDALKPKLEEGAPFRLLLLNPFSGEKEVRDRLNGIATQYDSKFRLDLAVNLYNRYRNVDVRISPYGIYCALFFSEKDLIYDPYHLGRVEDRIENYFLALRIQNKPPQGQGHSYYTVLKQHFECLWANAEELEEFTHSYREQLSTTSFKDVVVKTRYSPAKGVRS